MTPLRQGVNVAKPSPNVNSKCCVYCQKTGTKLFKCVKCHSGLYCSKICQSKDRMNHRVLCSAINLLETYERDKQFKNFTVSDHEVVTEKQKLKLITLIGHKPTIEFVANNVPCKGLWDTGSMVSVVNAEWLQTNFPDIAVNSIAEIAGETEKLSVQTANNTELPIEGVVPLTFRLDEKKFLTYRF